VNHVLLAAQLSEAVYRQAVPAGIDVVAAQTLRHAPTQDTGRAYVLDGLLVIAIAGSSIPAHWLSNFKIIQKDCFGWLRAHKGFSECAEGLLLQCLDIVNQWPDCDVLVTGHSRGGAIATLLAPAVERHLRRHGRISAIKLITFAQPRVSTESRLRAAFSGDYIRVVNGSDAVPRSPWLGYSHAGTVLYLANSGEQLADPSAWAMFQDRFLQWQQHERATDHRMSDYLNNLQRAQQ
jgi:hypothetical protein